MLEIETPVTFQMKVAVDGEPEPVVREFNGVLVEVHDTDYEIAYEGTTVMIPKWRVRKRL